jgi:thiamine-monophosphate kinase
MTGGGEHRWLRRLLAGLEGSSSAVPVGPGDDAAVLRAERRPFVVTTDALHEGVHFRRGWASWPVLGRRALRASLSDLSAMAAAPRASVLALGVPRGMAAHDLHAFARAYAAEGRRHGAPLVGGNVSRAARFAATSTVLGVLPGTAVTRAGARPGDALFVTGSVGGMAAAVRARRANRRAALPLPPVRVAAGLALAGIASAMIDVSDGIVQDLGHVCRASRVGAEVDLSRLPLAASCRRLGAAGRILAATGGEDYELLFTVPTARLRRLAAARLGCRVTRIGTILPGRRVRLRAGARVVRVRHEGFDHFG